VAQVTIRPLTAADRDAAVDVINRAARWYREFLPPEELHDPEMTAAQWDEEAGRLAWYGGFLDGVVVARNYKARGALEKAGYRLSPDSAVVLREYYAIPEDRLLASVTYEKST
jgi:hypothetical protein